MYIGDELLLNHVEIIISHEIRIPIQQPGFFMERHGFLLGKSAHLDLSCVSGDM